VIFNSKYQKMQKLKFFVSILFVLLSISMYGDNNVTCAASPESTLLKFKTPEFKSIRPEWRIVMKWEGTHLVISELIDDGCDTTDWGWYDDNGVWHLVGWSSPCATSLPVPCNC